MRTSPLLAMIAFSAMLSASIAGAAPGGLDPSFGTGGLTLTNVQNGNYGSGYAVALQSDGKIVMAGSGSNGQNDDFAVVRYNPDGSLDTSFDGDGIVTTYTGDDWEYATTVAIQPDGKIIAAGRGGSRFLAVRYEIDGSLDTDFGIDGILSFAFDASVDANALAVQGDGKIVIAGTAGHNDRYDFALTRCHPDGSLDTSFGNSGIAISDFSNSDVLYAIGIQSDGKIVAVGKTLDGSNTVAAVARYNADGSLDNTFGTNGLQTTSIGDEYQFGYAVVIQSDLRIVVAINMSFGDDIAIARYNTNGSLDEQFDEDGVLVVDFHDYAAGDAYPVAVAIQSDGNLLVAGQALGDFAVARYDSDGSPDTGFGDNGISTKAIAGRTEGARAVALQPDGKIVAAGYDLGFTDVGGNYSAFAAVRYEADGRLDAAFGDDGYVSTLPGLSIDSAWDLALQHDGKVVVVGSSRARYSEEYQQHPVVARYRSDGTLDPSFDNDGILIEDARNALAYSSVAIQADNKILVGGRILARYNEDGTLDTSFGENGIVTGAYSVIATQPDGKIITETKTGVARHNADGSLDPSFGDSGVITTDFRGAVAIQVDGKIVVAGTVPAGMGPDGETTNIAVARYNTSGGLDPDFGAAGLVVTDFHGAYDSASALTIQADGKLVVAGYTHSEDSEDCYLGCYVLARYNADGSVDEGFGNAGAVLTNANYGGDTTSVVIQDNGKIILTANQENDEDQQYGSDIVGARFNVDGSRDLSFGLAVGLADGDDWIASLALQSDGRIVWAGGYSSPAGIDIAVARHFVTDCGDEQVEPGEGCDDGNTHDGDGCSAGCTVETGWSCGGAHSSCNPIHGDGIIIGDEDCDDGNLDVDDGCSADGEIETGFKCSGEPSTCWWGCGDGATDSNEECDDGNTANGDGCSTLCELQQLCGDANADGRHSASDAVLILKAAIGIDVVCPTWICDVDGQGGPKATDALTVLGLSVGIAATVQCGDISALVLRLTDSLVVAGLNVTIDLSDVAGALIGTGSTVECENLIHGVTSVFNRPDVATLRIGYVSLDGIQGPVSLARCAFTTIRDVRSSDFGVSVEDAVDLSDDPIVPPPTIDAIPY